MKKTLELYQNNVNFEIFFPQLVKKIFFLLKNLLLIVMLFVPFTIVSQIKYGIYGGVNFAGVSSSYDNIRFLPIDKSGTNFMFGLHANKVLTDAIELETGLNILKKGYTFERYDEFYGIGLDEFNVFNSISIPLTIYYNIIPEDDYGKKNRDLILSVGGGFYGSYLLNGTITDEAGINTIATFGKMKRVDAGIRGSAKFLFGKHFEVFFTTEFGLVNLLKTDTGRLFHNSLIMGVGYQF